MASTNSASQDRRGILHIFHTVHEEMTFYQMMASPSFMKLFGVLRQNAFPRNIAIAAEEGLNLLAREGEIETVEDTLVCL
jgi:hypothetical protein